MRGESFMRGGTSEELLTLRLPHIEGGWFRCHVWHRGFSDPRVRRLMASLETEVTGPTTPALIKALCAMHGLEVARIESVSGGCCEDC